MQVEQVTQDYLNGLMMLVRGAQHSGISPLDAMSCMATAFASTIKASGGDSRDVSDAFRAAAESYDEPATGQHCVALRESSCKID